MKNENGLTPGCYGPSVIQVCWGTHWFTSAMVLQGSGATIDDNAWWSVVHGLFSQYRCHEGAKLYRSLQSCPKAQQTKAIEWKKMRTRSSRCPPPKSVVCLLGGGGGSGVRPIKWNFLIYCNSADNASTPIPQRCGGGQKLSLVGGIIISYHGYPFFKAVPNWFLASSESEIEKPTSQPGKN